MSTDDLATVPPAPLTLDVILQAKLQKAPSRGITIYVGETPYRVVATSEFNEDPEKYFKLRAAMDRERASDVPIKFMSLPDAQGKIQTVIAKDRELRAQLVMMSMVISEPNLTPEEWAAFAQNVGVGAMQQCVMLAMGVAGSTEEGEKDARSEAKNESSAPNVD